MNKLSQNFIIHPPGRNDAQAALDLLVACDIAEYGEADTELEEVLHDWEKLDLERDAWLVFSVDNTLVGYAAVFNEAAGFKFDFYTHPAYNLGDLKARLLGRCEARAGEHLNEVGSGGATARIIIPHVNLADRQAAEAAGFKAGKYHLRMQIDLAAPPPAAVWPAGGALRAVVPGQDDRLVYDFIYKVFDWRATPPPTFDWWRDFMMRPDHFKPELWYLLFQGETLIGAALCYDYPDLGWVRQLGVEPSRRRQGIGSALLHHVFGVFYRRGGFVSLSRTSRVGLGVEANNLKAIAFYEKIGMRRVRQYDEYYKEYYSTMDEIAQYNTERWEALARARAIFTRPYLDLDQDTARQMIDPWGRLGQLQGKKVLCLAGGGGQQSAALGLLGARVTVVDLAAAQLERDREAAAHYGLQIETVQGDMRDLSPLDEGSFDIVYHPYSINFVPEARSVFREVARVIREGGIYFFNCANPAFAGLMAQDWDGHGYPLKLPYQDGLEITYQDESWVFRGETPRQAINGPKEYRHTLGTLINGLIEQGFMIMKVIEENLGEPDFQAEPGSTEHFTAVAPPWLRFWATYRPGVLSVKEGG